jgi:hypothetical protein
MGFVFLCRPAWREAACLSLSKACLYFEARKGEGQGFDKLSQSVN